MPCHILNSYIKCLKLGNGLHNFAYVYYMSTPTANLWLKIWSLWPNVNVKFDTCTCHKPSSVFICTREMATNHQAICAYVVLVLNPNYETLSYSSTLQLTTKTYNFIGLHKLLVRYTVKI